MLAADGSSKLDAHAHDLGRCLEDSSELIGHIGIEQQLGVHIAVTGVEGVRHGDAVSVYDLPDPVQRLGQHVAGHHGITHHHPGSRTGQGRVAGPPPMPELVAFSGVARRLHGAGAAAAALLLGRMGFS